MYQVAHHEDDGTEGEYWFIYNDSVAGENAAFIGAYEMEREAIAECEKLMEEAGQLP